MTLSTTKKGQKVMLL